MVVCVTAGQTLRRYREAAKLTQEQVGLAVGKSAAVCTKWERDVHVPRRDIAAKLDDLLAAGGVLMQAWGYVAGDPLAELRGLVVTLTARVDTMQAQLEAVLGAAVDSPSQPSALPAQQSPGGGA